MNIQSLKTFQQKFPSGSISENLARDFRFFTSAKCGKFMRSQGFVPSIFTNIGSFIMVCILQFSDYIKGTEVLIPVELLTV